MILVTGATGNVGREVVNLLLDDGQEVAAVTRDPAAAALPGGAHVVGGDPSRPQTLTSALRGVEAVLISPRAPSGTPLPEPPPPSWWRWRPSRAWSGW